MTTSEEQTSREVPRLGGVFEVAQLLAISRSSLADRRKTNGFPTPVAELACGPIWDLDEMEAYKQAREKDPWAAYRWSNQPGRWERHHRRYPS